MLVLGGLLSGDRTSPPTAIATVRGRVLEFDGAVAGAEVRLTAVRPPPTLCDDDPVDGGPGCPEAEAQWRQRLDACTWPAETLAVGRSDPEGRFSLPRVAGATTVEVRVGDDVSWSRLPPGDAPIVVEHERFHDRITIRLVDGSVPGTSLAVRAGILLPDGHCVPLVREGDVWRPVVEHPGRGSAVAVAPGYHLAHGGETLELRRLGSAERHDLDADAPEDEPEDAPTVSPPDTCAVEVVDAHGTPVHGAIVNRLPAEDYELTRPWSTDETGCVEDEDHMLAGRPVLVRAPLERGFGCAARVVAPPAPAGTSRRIVLAEPPLPRSPLHLRFRTAAGDPIDRLEVRWWIGPETLFGCGGSNGWLHPGADGELVIPDVLAGPVTLDIRHQGLWYPSRLVTVATPAPTHTIVLEQGGTWRGRLFDPDGMLIDDARVVVRLEGHPVRFGEHVRGGFRLMDLAGGRGEAFVQLWHHPELGSRTLAMPVELATRERRRQDLRVPRGESIVGWAIDRSGRTFGRVVEAHPAGGGRPDGVDAVFAYTDSHGRFAFRHLAPGRWIVRIGRDTRREVATGTHDLVLVSSPDEPALYHGVPDLGAARIRRSESP
jgi:hypothetical protein